MLCFLLKTNNIFAATPPNLVEPTNNSSTTDTSPKLTWAYLGKCPADTKISCFKVEVDDSENFSSLNKNSYTNNTSYSPQLALGKWFWRVKAKDEENSWSEFSQVFSFTITTPASTSTSPSFSPTPSTTTGSVTGPSPQSSSSPKSSITLTSVPSQVSSTEPFFVDVQLTNLGPNSQYFLKGAFLKSGSTNYFGKTKVSSSWVKNSETYSKQLPITTDLGGNWTGLIQLMVDQDDSGFSGAGDYLFKVGRYSSTGSGPTWSSESSINISHTATNTKKDDDSSVSPTPPAKTTSTTAKPKSSPSPRKVTSAKSDLTSSKIKLATISGVSTQASKLPQPLIVKSASSLRWWLIGGGFLTLIIGAGLFVYTIKKHQ